MEEIFRKIDSELMEIAREALYVVTNLITTSENTTVLLSIVSYNDFQIFRSFNRALKFPDPALLIEIF